jgi:hypothetical protein
MSLSKHVTTFFNAMTSSLFPSKAFAYEDFLDSLQPACADGERIVNAFLEEHGRLRGNGYPFGNPVSVEKRHVDDIRRSRYLVAAKTDGIRLALVLASGLTSPRMEGVGMRNHECAFLVDRMHKMYAFPCSAEAALFKGTLVDMELVWDPTRQCLVLLAFDIAVVEGDGNVAYDPLTSRLSTLATMFPYDLEKAFNACEVTADMVAGGGGGGAAAAATSFTATNAPLRSFQGVKDAKRTLLSKGFMVADVPGVMMACKRMRAVNIAIGPQEADDDDGRAADQTFVAPYALTVPVPGESDLPCDGYVLTPEMLPASRPGTAWSIFKLKAAHTVDLLWSDNRLWYGDGDSMFELSTLYQQPSSVTISFDDPPPSTLSPAIVEMLPMISNVGPASLLSARVPTIHGSLDTKDSIALRRHIHLTFVSTRTDRDVPNNQVCILGSFNSVMDAVTLQSIENPAQSTASTARV